METPATLILLSASMLREPFGSPAETTEAWTERADASLTLDDWDGIHDLLTGTRAGGEGPEAFLLAGGRPFGGGRLFGPDEVAGIVAALVRVSEACLGKGYCPDDMTAKRVQGEWRGGPEGGEFSHLARAYARLWAFLADAPGKALFVATPAA